MRKTPWILAGTMFGITVVLIFKLIVLGNTHTKPDGKVLVVISEFNKAHILSEMREFLEGVQFINEALLSSKTESLEKAASQSGGLNFLQAPKGMLKSLPIEFKKMGASARLSFDDILDTHNPQLQPEILEKQLIIMMDNCMKCHNNYDFVDEKSELLKSKERLFAKSSF